MFCFKCGKELPDGSKFCPECGASQEQRVETPTPAVVVEEPVTVNEPLLPKDTSKLTSTFKSPLFLILTIFLTLVAVFYLTKFISKVTAPDAKIIMILITSPFDILGLVFSIIATIASWQMYAKANDAGKVGQLKGLPAILVIISIFELIGNALIGAVILAIFALLAAALSKAKDGMVNVADTIKGFAQYLGEETGEFEELVKILEKIVEAGEIVLIVIGVVLAFILIFAFIQKLIMHKHLKGYYGRLLNYAETGTYDSELKNPRARLFIFGVLFAIIGIYFLFFGNFITNLLGGWGTALSMIAFAGYYFVSGLYFNKVHAELSK